MTEPTSCYRERTNGVYFTRNAHRTDCTDPNCGGCRPCAEKRHCTAAKNCAWHVSEGELTCGRCITAARRDLRWIGALAALLMPAALGDGVDSEAANLAGDACPRCGHLAGSCHCTREQLAADYRAENPRADAPTDPRALLHAELAIAKAAQCGCGVRRETCPTHRDAADAEASTEEDA